MPNQKIIIDLSQNDLEDLMNGEVFNWTYTTDKGEEIDICLMEA